MSYCFVIPNYNHIVGFAQLLEQLGAYHLPIIIVDDGSQDEIASQLQTLANNQTALTLLVHPENQGKGAAMQTGFDYALEQGYQYAIQIDADGQHDVSDVATMLALSKQQPEAFISGAPVYDQSVPKHRFYARYITHFWVCVETLSLQLTDSMCGFRIYPLTAYQELMTKSKLGKRMDFDTEIMVRLYWQGVSFIFVPTKVKYPEDGVSHFRPFNDNVLISWLHTRLFFGMCIRLPQLLSRNIRRWFTATKATS
ncbi:MAG: glycosyltransferase family 2 protein [Cognaticolwellia aestuarii]